MEYLPLNKLNSYPQFTGNLIPKNSIIYVLKCLGCPFKLFEGIVSTIYGATNFGGHFPFFWRLD